MNPIYKAKQMIEEAITHNTDKAVYVNVDELTALYEEKFKSKLVDGITLEKVNEQFYDFIRFYISKAIDQNKKF